MLHDLDLFLRDLQIMFMIILLCAIIPISLGFWVISVILNTYSGDGGFFEPISPWRWLFSILAPIFLSLWGRRRKSLDKSGALAGLIIGFILTFSSACFFSSLLAFFFFASKATKFRSDKKKKLEADFKEGGQRNWVQVLCNGGVATEMAVLYLCDVGCGEKLLNFSQNYNATWWSMAVLGAIAGCCGDTFASELGTVLGSGVPRLITTLEKVPKGTNGGVTIVGTLASAFGGFIVGVAYYVTLTLLEQSSHLTNSPPQWPVVVVATLAGVMGSLIDSLLGATLQYSGYCTKRRCIVEEPGPGVEDISGSAVLDNHGVNLLSSLFSSLFTPRIAFHIWRTLQ
ncbi:transmembrane protein 19 [Lingula anatina]|uniref:Transmembrane protein 19 n=1 Tax=Lingula anatina TaxID=7574 RepID=A0A1S3IXY4_LINAN|nr:transmembrane protein 19 [Lingula anatina]|eukprot:XP_013402409.1 transmembrane protein 19 [Lingula anatina]